MSYPVNAKIRIIKKSTYNRATGCLEWFGAKDNHGYGRIVFGSKKCGAHRVMLELKLKRRLYDKVAMHTCNNPSCISVAVGHVTEGTQKDNISQASNLGRMQDILRWHQKG